MLRATLIAAACVGAAIGIASVPQEGPATNQPDTLAKLVEPDSVLAAKFDASVNELRRLEAEEQAAQSITPTYQPSQPLHGSQSLTIRELTIFGGGSAPPLGISPVANTTNQIAPFGKMPALQPTPSYDRTSSAKEWLARQGLSNGTVPKVQFPGDFAAGQSTPPSHSGVTNIRNGDYYAPADPNGYTNTKDGTFYGRSSPGMVLDTRTGWQIHVSQ